MKRNLLSLFLLFTLLISLVIAFTGCQSSKETAVDLTTPLTDGEYTATGEIDDRGWTPTISLTVEGGKIVNAIFNESNAEGKTKSTDQEYADKMKEKVKITIKEAYDQLTSDLLDTQHPSKVDAVAGATSSSNKFKAVALKAVIESQSKSK